MPVIADQFNTNRFADYKDQVVDLLDQLYAGVSSRTLARDLEELQSLKLLQQEGNEYFANISVLSQFIAGRKGLTAKKII